MVTLDQINKGADHFDKIAKDAAIYAEQHRRLESIHADEWQRISRESAAIAARLRSLASSEEGEPHDAG